MRTGGDEGLLLCKADGQSYERAAITAWMQEHGMPLGSKAPAQTHNMIPDHKPRSMTRSVLQ
jgi:hypothetical protein